MTSGGSPVPPASRPAGSLGADVTRLVLVRHGEAEGNRELRYLGSSDVALTKRGEAQAIQLREALRPFPLRAIYTSPLRRASETAGALAAERDLTPIPWADLREEDFGVWERLTHAEARERDPDTLAAWDSGADVAPPGGESLTDVRARAVAAADALAGRHSGETIALVSHVGPIKALVCAALGLPVAGARRIWLDPASITVLDWRPAPTGASGTLRIFNAVAHLDPPVRWLQP